MRLVRVVIPLIVFLTVSWMGRCDGLVLYRSGSVNIDQRGTGDWLPAKVDMEIPDDAVIRTGPDSLVEIELDGELVSIGENRTVAVRELAGRVEKKKKTGLLQSLYGSL